MYNIYRPRSEVGSGSVSSGDLDRWTCGDADGDNKTKSVISVLSGRSIPVTTSVDLPLALRLGAGCGFTDAAEMYTTDIVPTPSIGTQYLFTFYIQIQLATRN